MPIASSVVNTRVATTIHCIRIGTVLNQYFGRCQMPCPDCIAQRRNALRILCIQVEAFGGALTTLQQLQHDMMVLFLGCLMQWIGQSFQLLQKHFPFLKICANLFTNVHHHFFIAVSQRGLNTVLPQILEDVTQRWIRLQGFQKLRHGTATMHFHLIMFCRRTQLQPTLHGLRIPCHTLQCLRCLRTFRHEVRQLRPGGVVHFVEAAEFQGAAITN
mmetsp:Transcript_3750/g.8711  ORF Transcript_3750/g.8711 Transcript_3750/m.8711 type:complete len:216 (-) Transcript_3750:106-753(-)